MCGIFGSFSLNAPIDTDVIRKLAWFNEARGKDSFGFFSENSFLKRVGKISSKYPSTWVKQNDSSRYICGHCRFATRGAVSRRNSHPFFYTGKHEVVGVHNGIVPAPWKYTVDSEWIFDGLAQEGLSFLYELNGYWGIAFVLDGDFYLAARNQDLSFCVGENLYFSSDSFDLAKATGLECYEIDDQIVKIDSKLEVTELDPWEWECDSELDLAWNKLHDLSDEEWEAFEELGSC